MADSKENSLSPSPRSVWRFLPVIILLVGLAVVLIILRQYGITSGQAFWDLITGHHASISAWAVQNTFLALAVYMAIYIAAVALSLPGAIWLTLFGGAVLGWPAAGAVIFSGTIGAWLVFLAARGAFSDILARSSKSFMGRIKSGFEESPFFWLLALRLIPVAPFWVVNIIPGLLGMRSAPYLLATLIGIAPGSIVYVWVGRGLDKVLSQGRTPDFETVLDPSVTAPLIALGVLALVPALVKAVRAKGGNKT